MPRLRALALLTVILAGCGGTGALSTPSAEPAAPRRVSASESIPLRAGWNAVAFTSPKLTALTGSALGLASYQGTDYTVQPVAPANVSGRLGYWVYADSPGALSYTGESDGGNASVPVRAGWNLVAFPDGGGRLEPASILYEIQPDNSYRQVTDGVVRRGFPYWLFAQNAGIVTPVAPPAGTLTVSPGNLTVGRYATASLTAAVNGTDVTQQATWTSSDGSVAAFVSPGQVKGLAPGTVTVTASVAGATAQANVTVTDSGTPGPTASPSPPAGPFSVGFPGLRLAMNNTPNSVNIADMNGDGNNDVIVTNSGASLVTVRLQDGSTGTFLSTATYSAGNLPRAGRVRDFNGDGRLDVVLANRNSNTISVLLNIGGGALATRIAYTTGAGANPESIAIADFDGDGDVDVATANRTGSVSILRNNGNGTFGTPAVFTLVGTDNVAIVAADFTGDGVPDLAAADINSLSVIVLRNDGTGAFSFEGSTSVGSAPVDLATGDLNGDGRADLIVGRSTTALAALLGNGTGGFGTPTDVAVPSAATAVALGDFTADGRPDIVTAMPGVDRVAVLLASGAPGNFGPAVAYDTGDMGGGVVTTGDLNRDGRVDIASGDVNAGTSSIFFNLGTGVFNTRADYATPANPFGIQSGDFNRDGRLDLAVACDGANLVAQLLASGPAGTFGAFTTLPGTSMGTNYVEVADLNADGFLDLLATGASTAIRYWLGMGTGVWGASSNLTTAATSVSISTADLNKDGFPDVMVSCNAGDAVSVLLSTGPATYAPATNYPVTLNPRSVAAADFNGDGNLDLAIAVETANQVDVRLATAPGVFGAATPLAAGTQPFFVQSGDLNADGRPDLAVANFGANSVSVLLATGPATFAAAVDYPVGAAPREVRIADVNRDGRPDLLTASDSGQCMTLLLARGAAGTFGAANNYFTLGNPRGLTLGDFNADGRLDAALSRNSANSVGVLLNLP